MAQLEKLVKLTLEQGKDAKLLFIGDSITQGWEWDLKSRNIWAKHYTPRQAYNYGISGSCTEQVLYRIANKEFDGLNPKVTVLMIGTNDLWWNTVEEIAQGVQEILKQLAMKLLDTKFILVSILPRAQPLEIKAKQLNVLIKKLADDKTVHWLDLSPEFETPEGHQKPELYLNDKIHPNAAGYDVWQRTMEPLLNKLYPLN